MRLYQVSSIIRYVYVGNRKCFPSPKVKCLDIDGVGIFVYYDRERQLDLEFIKTYQPILKKEEHLIVAKNFKNAIKRFFVENQGTAIGGDKIRSRALRIDPEKIIVELPFCPLMHDFDGKFFCGEPCVFVDEKGKKEIDGEIGMCVVENHRPPKDCTFISFERRLLRDYDKYRKIAKRVLGFKVLKSNQVQPAEFPPMGQIGMYFYDVDDI